MDKDFERAVTRIHKLRLTETEAIDRIAGLPYITYWRAKNAKVGANSRIKVLRQVEAMLDSLEALPAICGLCERRSIDPTIRSCTQVGCPMQQKNAA